MPVTDSFLEMREARRLYLEIVNDPNATAHRKKLARHNWAYTMQKAIYESNIRKYAWVEEQHPRAPDGKFTSGSGSSGPSDSDWLVSSGSVRSMPGNIPKKFASELAKTMRLAAEKYPKLKFLDVKVVKSKDEVMGVRNGNLEVSDSLLRNMAAYGRVNEFHSGLDQKAYTDLTRKQIAGYQKASVTSPEAKNMSESLKAMALGEVDVPKTHYVASTISDMVWHELGHLALSRSSREAEKVLPGVDMGGPMYQLMGGDDLKSALKLSHYAGQAAEEYAAEAWCAANTGRENLLDERSRKLVNIMRAAST